MDRADRRVEPLLERAAVIARFHRLGGARFRAEIIRARHAIADAPPIEFEIRPGLGLADAPAPDLPRAARRVDESIAPLHIAPEGFLGDIGGGRGRPPA